MGMYSEALLRQLGQIGQPLTSKTVTSTTGMDQNQGLDLPSLIMMLYFSDAFKKGTGTAAPLMPSGGFGTASGLLGLGNQPSVSLGTTPLPAPGVGILPNDLTLDALFKLLGGR